MTYILDTNICIHILRENSFNILKHAKNKSSASILLSDITVAELWHGVWMSKKVKENEQLLNNFLISFTKLPFDSAHARMFGILKSEQQKKGKMLGPFDLQIAAQALEMDAILITANEKEFKQIKDLRIENWLKP